MTQWQDRIIGTEEGDPTELIKRLHPDNPKTHPEAQLDSLEHSLARIGWIARPIWNKQTGYFLDGNGRIKLAMVSGQNRIKYDVVDLSPEEEKYILLTFDTLVGMAEPDAEKLLALMDDVGAELPEGVSERLLEMIGEADVEEGETGVGSEAQVDRAKQLRGKWQTATGQLWQLGEHRLYIEDVANNKAKIDYFLHGDPVGLVVTDPPFTFGLASTMKGASKVGGWVDLMNSAQWFASWYSLVYDILDDNGAMWTCCSWRSFPIVARASDLANWGITSLLIWDKDWIGPGGPQGLRPSYEMVALFCKKNFAIPNRGLRDIWTVPWSSHKPTGHSAEKPLDLFSKIISESGGSGVVLDLFGGSGTTIIACEQLNRKGRIAEMSPDYAALILQRWVDLTGQQPQLTIDNC